MLQTLRSLSTSMGSEPSELLDKSVSLRTKPPARQIGERRHVTFDPLAGQVEDGGADPRCRAASLSYCGAGPFKSPGPTDRGNPQGSKILKPAG